MTADNQRQIDSRRDALHIGHRIPLGRNFGFKAHVEILFPADDGVIRAAESDKRMPFAQQIGDGGKLLFQFGIHPVCVADKLNIPKPRAFHQRGQQLSVLLDVIGQRRFFPLVDLKQLLCRVAQGDSPVERIAHDIVVGHIRQIAQQQRVHVTQRHAIKRQIASPNHIILYIGHGVLPFALSEKTRDGVFEIR